MNDEEIQLLTDFLSGASTGSELYDSVPQGVFKSFFPVKYQEHPQVRKLYFQFRKQRQDLKERVNKNIQKEYGGIIVRTEDTFNENENEINYSEHLFAQLCELNEQLNEAIDETQSECISIENKINLMCEEAGNLNAKKFNEIDPSLLQKILTEIEEINNIINEKDENDESVFDDSFS